MESFDRKDSHRIGRSWLIVAALTAGSAHGQTSGSSFRGEVRDASKAIVSQASILIRSVDNGMEIASESNHEGLYITPDLIPGSYVLSAAKSGFRTEIFGPVVLHVNQTARVDFALNIGVASESVRVEATAVQLLSTEGAEISQVVSRKQVTEIPLNGRAWQQLITVSAGTNPGAPGESGSPNPVM